jgi:serine/threonine-protein kinase CTR1
LILQVCDFGLSRVLSGEYISTTSGIGTPQWTAPEVMRGDKVSEKSDVFSFGVVLWEIAMLEQPWKQLRPEQVVFAVGGGGQSLHLSSHLQPEVSSLIQDCLCPQPHERPSFAVIIERLSQLTELKNVLPSSSSSSLNMDSSGSSL